MATIRFTAGTTVPRAATLKNTDGSPVDLGNAAPHAVVSLQMRPIGGGTMLTASCTVLQALSGSKVVDKGRVQWVWPGAASPSVRVYRAKFQVTFVDGTVEFFPSDEFEDVVVEPAA